jgi:hypothetical protein
MVSLSISFQKGECGMNLKDAYALLCDPLLLLPKTCLGAFPEYLNGLFEAFKEKMLAVTSRYGLLSLDQLDCIDSLNANITAAWTQL